jgi:hypothetical protein
MTDTPQILLAHNLKALKLPTFLREYDKVARLCAARKTTACQLRPPHPGWGSTSGA